MNQYCNRLNFPIGVNVNFTDYKKNSRVHVRGDVNMMSQEVHEILKSVGVEIRWVEVFYLGANADHTIHCDGHELDDKAKINYIFGGKDSLMTWYEPKNESDIEKLTSLANTIYLGIKPENVTETYSRTMEEGYYLVLVGKFHNVWNKYEDRYCLSGCLEDSKSKYRLSFPELQKRLKDYIND